MDLRIQNSVAAGLSQRPRVVEVGPFVIGCDPASDSRYLNYATPRPGAGITAADVPALVTAFRDLGRVPRLEYVVSCAPDLERHLTDAGFTVEARHDYLVCSPDSLVPCEVPQGFQLAEPGTDAQRAAMVAVQNEAFGGEPVATTDDVARVQRAQDLGGVVVFAEDVNGTCAGAGQGSPPSAGVSEVGGIAVQKAFRGRGIGGALTAAIAARLFASGVDVAWLEASGEESWRVYERAGFAPTGKRLYIALD